MMTSRARRYPGHRPSVVPETRSGAAFLGFIIIGACAQIGDLIAMEAGHSGDVLLGYATYALWVAGLSSTAAIWLRAYRISRIPSPGHCKTCGYNLTGNVSRICPGCGTPMQRPV